MSYIVFATMLILAAGGVVSLYRQLQMLQQNSYFPSRYFGWLKQSYTIELAVEAVLYCVISLFLMNRLELLVLILSVLLLAIRVYKAINIHKKSIKKLVFTARVKRLYITAILVLGILIFGFFVNYYSVSGNICRTLCLLLSVLAPLLSFVVWAVTYPIEKAISYWYTNDAKRILKEHKKLTVIGITGSYGKTTTKFILNRILSEKFNTVCTPQSFNTQMGVVRTVRSQIKPQTQIFICEMGAKKAGDIKEICDIANPNYGIITSVGEQHLDTFKSVRNVFKTKFELADAVSKKGGITLANIDSNGIAARASGRQDVVYFGTDTKYRAQNIYCSEEGTVFDLYLDGAVFTVSTKLLGFHSVSDILAAAAMAHILGVDDNDIKFAISTLKPTEHRLELKQHINGSLLIDDAYNSNPEGCLEAVRVLGSFMGRKKVIITPGLIELGKREYDCNYALGLEATKYCDVIILVGKSRSKPMCDAIETTDFNKDNVYVVSSFKEAMEIYSPMADKNSIVLLENDLPDNYLN